MKTKKKRFELPPSWKEICKYKIVNYHIYIVIATNKKEEKSAYFTFYFPNKPFVRMNQFKGITEKIGKKIK